jgi:F0F1-type ATP synthase membrane subunit c/vacuolar-type H+-ATPase subunit K
LTLLMAGSRRFLAIGLLIGLSAWVRPDGITLLGPAAFTALLIQPTWAKRLRGLLAIGLGFASLFAFYLFFNLAVSGSAWPNTFYAKQAEYAIYLQLPFWQRLGQQLLQPLIGVGIILLPGAIWMLIPAIRKRNWGALAALLWAVGFLGLYALRLPVTYQHGRYVIPAMPIFFILGLAGLADLTLRKLRRTTWFLPVFWRVTAGLTLLIFYGRGAFAYAQDVAVIESEMVTVAGWVSENVPAGALVAAHDIGALGYFGNCELVDLAGLISPDVIPFIRDESRLANYLNERGVDYLVTFPDWYPSLTSNLSPIFSTGEVYAPALGETNMAVYKLPGP